MSRLLACTVVGAALLLCACRSDAPDDSLDRQLDLAFSRSPDNPFATLAAAQRELFTRLQRDDDTAAGMMTIEFMLMNEEVAPDPVNTRNMTAPRFAHLAYRFAPGTLPDGEMEIRPESPTRAFVIVHEPGARPAITWWRLTSDGWRATSLQLNASERTMERLRRVTGSLGPVQQ